MSGTLIAAILSLVGTVFLGIFVARQSQKVETEKIKKQGASEYYQDLSERLKRVEDENTSLREKYYSLRESYVSVKEDYASVKQENEHLKLRLQKAGIE